ncbi:uncharacterized protein LOC111115489 [Crassostrea virginica]
MTGMVRLVCCSWAALLCLSVQAYENLALHKPAWQSSTYSSDYSGADRAVDGQYTDLRLTGGQCAASDGGVTAEWRVDLTMTGMALLVCCGWTLLRCLSVQAYENLALHQPVWQSNTWRSYIGTTYTSYTADRAVDGRYTDLELYGGQCAASDYGEQTAEWRVDLGGVRNIHHIVIQYATDNRVWGCSSPGYYGGNCSLECPQNCQNGYCDIVEGTCFGCSHQYIGPTCEDCPSGLYGSNCSQNCSMTCGDPGECDMRTGHCYGGCQVGRTGAMCETGYHLTINITHENFYIMKPSYIVQLTIIHYI